MHDKKMLLKFQPPSEANESVRILHDWTLWFCKPSGLNDSCENYIRWSRGYRDSGFVLWPEATHLTPPSSCIDSVDFEFSHHPVGFESRIRCFMKDDVSSNMNSTSATMTASSCLM